MGFIPLYIPLLYSRTGVYRGKHYFLIFALKHTHNICFEQKCENSKKNVTENYHYYNREKSHGHVFVMRTDDSFA